MYKNFIINMFKQNRFKKNCLIIITQAILIENIVGQEAEHLLKVHYNPTDQSYFWLENNNYGKNIIKNEIEYNFKFSTKKTDYRIGLSNAYSKSKDFSFSESFIKHNFSDNTFLRLGRYYRDFSMYLNDDLSSGSMLVSKNARTMPKIGLVSSQKIKKKSNITFDFGLAHGFFDKNYYYPKAPYLHEKFIYINIRNNNYLISIGFVHEAMWGGSNWSGDLPSTFKDFTKVFIADDDQDFGIGGHTNAVGNHLGIWDFYYEKNNGDQLLKLYYQHFFEDTSSLRFINKTDGLWGVELENYIPDTNIVLEYLDTSHCCIDPPYQDDDYYGNYQYIGGWKYQNNILGNPFVNNLPPLDEWVRNRELTRLVHLGIKGNIQSNYFEIKSSRKVNVHDSIKYSVSLGRTINQYIDINIFTVSSHQKNGVGFGLSYTF